MPVPLTYPGVYIEELPSTVRTITGVSTSITAFIGRALRGPTDEPILIHSFTDYERTFGGLWKLSNMSYAVFHYFLNGGKDAVIVRVYKPVGSSATVDTGKATFTAGGTALGFITYNPGLWGQDLLISTNTEVDPDKLSQDSTLFNLFIRDRKTGDVNDINKGVLEKFLNISLNSESPKFVKGVLEEESDLIRVREPVPNTALPSTKTDFSYDSGTASDGVTLSDPEFLGTNILAGEESTKKKGIRALDDIDLFNMLCIPPYNDETGSPANTTPVTVYESALTYCENRRAMLLVDPPSNWNDKDRAKNLNGFTLTRKANAAVYFPRILVPDPLEENRSREFVPCGAVAGVIARTDSQRGIWKSPAGIEATLAGIPDLTVRLTDEENGELNPLGINCLRLFSVAGRVVWGARTWRGDDRLADQWKYLAVRRMALYIEESLYRGTQWVVFEPNDEPLWSQIRLNVGAFMNNLFRQSAFQGKTPKEAYLVKCDSETTTQFDIDRGIVNIVIGFAPLKPAEFVILKIQQLAGRERE